MIASPKPGIVFSETAAEKIPNVLIHEIIDGKPYYYKGYHDVLAGRKTVDDIMGCSTLQAFIIAYLLKILFKGIDEDLYLIATGEPGLHLDKSNNLAADIMIFDGEVMTVDQINLNYAQVPPKISIEVDTNVELEDITENEYVILKTTKLVNFGVEKVIWFFTKAKKVIVVDHQSWASSEWDSEVNILPDITCNVGEYLRSKGSKFA